MTPLSVSTAVTVTCVPDAVPSAGRMVLRLPYACGRPLSGWPSPLTDTVNRSPAELAYTRITNRAASSAAIPVTVFPPFARVAGSWTTSVPAWFTKTGTGSTNSIQGLEDEDDWFFGEAAVRRNGAGVVP